VINPKLPVSGVRLITAVGSDAEMTAAVVKVGISIFQETDYFDEDFK